MHLSSYFSHSLFLLFYVHSVFPLILFLPFFFPFSSHYCIHTFLFVHVPFKLSSLSLHSLYLSCFTVSIFLSFLCFYFHVFFLISSFRLPFLIQFFQFLLLISSIQFCYFYFFEFFFLVPSFRLLIDTFFPYFISSFNSFVHSISFLTPRYPSLYRFTTIACSVCTNDLPCPLNTFSSITKIMLILMCKQQSADPGGRAG
jgi:hypothetical protein